MSVRVQACLCPHSLTCVPPPLSCHPPWPLCRLFIDGDRIDDPNVKEHLLFDLGLEAEYRIQVVPYKSILSELQALCADLSPREKVWVSDKASYAVSEAIPKVGGPTSALNPVTLQLPALPALALGGFVFEAVIPLTEPSATGVILKVGEFRALKDLVLCFSESGMRADFWLFKCICFNSILACARKI